jgi:hypothetical protein
MNDSGAAIGRGGIPEHPIECRERADSGEPGRRRHGEANGGSSLGNDNAFGLYSGVSSVGIGRALRFGISTVDSLAGSDAAVTGKDGSVIDPE